MREDGRAPCSRPTPASAADPRRRHTPIAVSTPVSGEFSSSATYPAGPMYADLSPVTTPSTAPQGPGVDRTLLSGSSDKLFYRRVSDLFTGRKAKGANLVLTINAKARKRYTTPWVTNRGAAVALNPKTGEILAMVSKLSYDPNALASHDLAALGHGAKALNGDPARPLVNPRHRRQPLSARLDLQVVDGCAPSPAGSSNPTASCRAGQSRPAADNGRSPEPGGRACGADDKVSLTDALRISCNTAFGWLGMELGGGRPASAGGEVRLRRPASPCRCGSLRARSRPSSTSRKRPSPPSASTTCASRRRRWPWSRQASPTRGRREALPVQSVLA